MIKSIDEILCNLPKYFLIIMVALILAHISFLIGVGENDADWLQRFALKFHLNIERNFPTWFSSIILMISSLLLYIIYRTTLDLKPNKFWAFLSLIFIFLSLDEAVSIHEHLNIISEYYKLHGFFYYSWVIAGIAFVLIIGITSIPFLKSLPSKAAAHFIIAGFIYCLGAIGMEMIGAYFVEMSSNPTMQLWYEIMVTIEESLEMIGIVFFNFILIRYLKYTVNNNAEY